MATTEELRREGRGPLRDETPVDLPTVETEEGLETEELILNMGPQHPSTHGVLRLVLRLSGEKVVECIPVMGYLHRGIEKLFEWRTFHQGIRYADQADYVSNMLQEHAYAGAMEAIGGIEVPRRAEYLRVIVDEMSRCASHLVWLGTYGLDVGATTPVLWCFRDREEILDMFEEICGSRMNFNYYRPGGLLYDLPPGLLGKLTRFLDRFEKHIEEDYVTILDQNEIFLERTIGVGTIPADVALQYGVTGPMLRASGVDWDLRRDRPYGAYRELKSVRPVIYKEGDAYARYRVRLEEMKVSIQIIRECVDRLPGGSVRARLGHVWKCPAGEAYYTVEGAKGEVGIYMISDGRSKNPFRAKMRGPSFVNLQLLPWLLKGRLVADVVAILGSIDIVLGDVDR
ncbi:MAG TPA: NADH-quinone oxidoreductase subunit D [Candidatus Limnocylindria bacterium]|nr:NADH-quinone oxidoreductase subunit D [Candidatus Limnocylindria bacterium]